MVLIVAKCNVNSFVSVNFGFSNWVLIVAKCNVNVDFAISSLFSKKY